MIQTSPAPNSGQPVDACSTRPRCGTASVHLYKASKVSGDYTRLTRPFCVGNTLALQVFFLTLWSSSWIFYCCLPGCVVRIVRVDHEIPAPLPPPLVSFFLDLYTLFSYKLSVSEHAPTCSQPQCSSVPSRTDAASSEKKIPTRVFRQPTRANNRSRSPQPPSNGLCS